jgi:phenylalanyl-tRNA synthetase beta chain
MKLSYQWLQDYIDLTGISPQQLGDALTGAGLEVEGAIAYTGPRFTNVVVAKVLALTQHPNADKLRLVSVNLGEQLGTTEVVCGAPNVAEGQLIAFAQNGATVYSKKTGAWFTLTPAVIRGVASEGMVCSLEELALETQFSQPDGGIWVLNDLLTDAQIGLPLIEALHLGENADAILETAPTANRGDWMSYLGMAREVSALYHRSIRPQPTVEALTVAPHPTLNIALEDPTVCDYYSGAVITGVTVKPSPQWVQARLAAAGIRAINNVVDVTNFVMLELGQPLHTFDAELLGLEGSVGVRYATAGETLACLDEQTYTLTEQSVVITKNNVPVALAGVMGGASTAIHEGTSTVFLEAACFPTSTTRRSARSVGIRTESSARFERGVDAGSVQTAMQRAIYLLQNWAGGQLVSWQAVGQPQATVVTIPLRLSRLAAIIGKPYTTPQVTNALQGLGFSITAQSDDLLTVSVPSFRQRDVVKEIDLIEEVVRIDGYATVPEQLPATNQTVVRSIRQRLLSQFRAVLCGLGLNEVMTTSLVGEALLTEVACSPATEQLVRLSNSHSSEHTLLRQSVLPTLLEVLKTNLSFGEDSLWLYELGRAYFKRGKASHKQTGVQEKLNLAIALVGQPTATGWQAKHATPTNFYTLKGITEAFLERFGFSIANQSLAFQPLEAHHALAGVFHPGRCATAILTDKQKPIAVLGQVHPSIQKQLKSKQPIFLLELDADTLLKLIEQRIVALASAEPSIIALSPYPAISRDMAFSAPTTLSHQAVLQFLETHQKTSFPALTSVVLFDEYQGEGVQEGHRSLAYRFVWQTNERTLTDAEVDGWMTTLRQAFEQQLGVALR